MGTGMGMESLKWEGISTNNLVPHTSTLCDAMWHVSSRSGVATLRTAIHLLLTYTTSLQ